MTYKPVDILTCGKHSLAIYNKRCTWCEGEVTSFRDKISEKEYSISGFCQSCQDKAFSVPEEFDTTCDICYSNDEGTMNTRDYEF